MPRFVRDLAENGKEILSMNNVMSYLLEAGTTPLVDEMELMQVTQMPRLEWENEFVDKVRGTLVQAPGMKPPTIRVDQLDREQLSENEMNISRKRDKEESRAKKKKKSEKKEKKSKKSRKSGSPSQEKNALEMAQEFSKEYEPIKARKMKVFNPTEAVSQLNTSQLTLDTSQDDHYDYGLKVEISGDVMKSPSPPNT